MGSIGQMADPATWLGMAVLALTALVAALTLLSIAFYVAEWVRHMNRAEIGS